GGGAPGRQAPRRRHLPGLPAAFPADPDDHDGGVVGSAALGTGDGGGVGAAAAAGHRHRRWAARQPAAHALHHAGDLAGVRPLGATSARETGMNLSALFITRPVATTLLTIGLALTGMLAFGLLPVSPLPQVDFPTIQVSAQLPGASPETMATSV